MEKEIIELNEGVLSKLTTLDKTKVYFFEVEVGDMSKTEMMKYLTGLKKAADATGVTGIFVPSYRGINSFKITELKKYLEENV